ncbi:twitchin-like isoform X6 [Biomphalaria glabrata]|uniref:Titin n=1 Tax=Biomphalaria glabrata TaxID=6526 RepID=A0A9W3BLL6_BIOGL|nr:twitchin-like isoform X6 [Biomphalaria glabrata]
MGVGDDVAPRFTQKPALRQEDNGQKLVFHCVLEASPKPDIAWFMGTTPLKETDRTRMRTESAGGAAFNVILEIVGVTQSDAGTYKVVAKNRLGEVSASINLNFSAAGGQKQQEGIAPNFIQKPVTRQENNGKKLLFECSLTSDPAPAITWYKDNAVIQSEGRFNIRAEPRENKTYFLVLEINDVAAQDAGNYKVTAKNTLGESNATIRLNFDSSVILQQGTQPAQGSRPQFVQKPTIRQSGQAVIIECQLTADPSPSVSWFHNNLPIQQSSRLLQDMRSEEYVHQISLQISQVTLQDGGEYRAVARNTLGEATATITLNFEGSKKPQGQDGKAPHFTQKPTIKQQQNLLLMTCLLEAKPAPQIRWFRDTTEVGDGGRYSITIQRDPSGADLYTVVLQIRDPATEDAGTYKCTAANDLGESNANITLNFQGGEKPGKPPTGIAPAFKEKPKVAQDASGKNIVIECQCSANPKPTITWYKGTSTLQASSRIVPTLIENGNEYTLKLEILNFTKDDGGQYKVTAKNDFGEGNANITINLEGPKEPPPVLQGKPNIRLDEASQSIIIEQGIQSAVPPTVSWYFGNQPLKSDNKYKIDLPQEKGLYYSTLRITSFSDKDSGTYKLVVKTAGGEATSTATVNVSALKPKVKGEAPKFVQNLTPKIVNDGDKVEFVVKVSGTEPIEVNWSKDKKPIKSGDIFGVTYDKGTAKLSISEVFPEDSGNYTVEIKNQWGSASSTASLQVKELPEEKLKNDQNKTEAKPKDSNKIEIKSQQIEESKMEIRTQSKTKQDTPVEEIIEAPKAKPKEESAPPPPPKKVEEKKEEPKKTEVAKKPEEVKKPEAKKPEEPKKPEEAPAIVVDEDEKGRVTNRGKQVKKAAPGKDEEPKDGSAPKSKTSKSKGSKPYLKQHTTILEELEEDGFAEGESDQSEEEEEDDQSNPFDAEDSDEGKASIDLKDGKKPMRIGDGPTFKEKPVNQVVFEGDDLKITVTADPKGKPAPAIKFYRGPRELKDDSRVSIRVDGLSSTFGIKRTRLTDEAKYTVNIESEGAITDTATFSVFIKDPKDSQLDYRALLKHRDQGKKQAEEEDVDWGSLKPVDKKGRRLSQIEVMKMSLKKVEKAEGSDSEEEKQRSRRESRSQVEYERDTKEITLDKGDDKQKPGSRRQSIENETPVKKASVDKLEALEQTRRASMQTRRASLAEVIPDWPTLIPRKVIKEEPDKFNMEMEDIKCLEGVASATFVAEFCKPDAKVKWFKNKLEIFHGHKYHFESDHDDYKLTINNVKVEDGGKYTCQCNDISTSAWLYVEAKEPEYYFTQKLPDTYKVKRKKTGVLECFVSDPRARVKWYKGDDVIEYTPGKFEIQRRENRCIFKIVDATPEDEGTYTCQCGDAKTSTKVLVVEPEWEFLRKLEDVEAVEREKATMECDVSDPEADVIWLREGKDSPGVIEELKAGGKYEFVKEGLKRRLVVKNCSIKDDGKYTCQVLDQTTTAELFVSPDVKFMKKLVDKTCKEKETIALECKATNPHKHPFQWLKNGVPIKTDLPKYESNNKGEVYKLTVKDVDIGDSGEYTIQIGERPNRCNVTVQPLPRPPKIDASKVKDIFVKKGDTIELNIPFDGAPVPRALWSKDGKHIDEGNLDTVTEPKMTKLTIPAAQRSDTGSYELTLTNDAGEDKVPVKITVMDAPEAPQGPLEVVDIFSNRCALLWDKPKEDGGSPVTHYIVEKMDAGKGEWEKVCETDDVEVDVCDLTPGHHYQFRVSAVNSQGVSEPLPTEGTMLAKDPWDPTSPPGEPNVIDYDKDYAELEWTPPEKENGAPVSGYLIEFREKGEGEKDWKKGVETGPENKGTVKGLKENKEYEFRVIAKNKAGPSEPSVCSEPVLCKSRKVKPRIDQKTVPQNIRIKVGQKFTLGPITFIGEPNPQVSWLVKNLKQEEAPFEPTDVLTLNNKPKETTIDCRDGLRKHTGEYILTVTNKHGSDSATISVVVLGPPGRPGGPLEVKEVTKDSATITWKPPQDDGGSDIKGYRVEKFDMDKGKWEKVATVQGNKCVVPKLQEGHDYKFRVIAEGPNGDSEPLELENPITAKNPFEKPSSPGKPEVVDRDRTFIEMKWEPPRDDGGAPIAGYEVERKEPKTNRWIKLNKNLITEPQFKDEKVQEGKEYEYRVYAVNEAGPSEPSATSAPVVAKPLKEVPKVNLDNLFGAKEIRVRAGEPININLGICGAPEPTVEWLKGGKPLGNRAQLANDEKEAKLHIPKAERGDTGKYSIKVANKHGDDTAEISVVVLDKPGEPEGPLEISDLTAEGCKLTWKPPKDNGGAEVTGYVVEKCEEGSTYWEKVPGVITGQSINAKGLKEGKNYKFRVKAENIYGLGEPLESQKITAKNPFDTPDAPRDLEITKYDRSSVTLSWKEPTSDGGNPIKGYLVEKKEKGKDWTKASVFPVPETTYTVLKLTEGSEVEFRVMAVNDGGPGKPSKTTPKHIVRDPVFPAGAPNTPNVDKITKDSVTLSWSKPSNDGGSKLTGFVVEKKKKGEDWMECATVPPNQLTATIPKLKEGEEYQFRVRADNAVGAGEPSKPTNSIIAADQPEKPKLNPTGLKDINVKAGQEFTIKVPFSGTPKPTAKWTLNGEGVADPPRITMTLTDDHAILHCAKAKRDNTGKYELTLKNDEGTDTMKINVNVLDKPGAPVGPIEASDFQGESLTLTWKPPKDDGGEKIANYIVEKRKAGTGRWQKVSSFLSKPTCEVRNLEPGTKYEFRVAAENPQGVSDFLETETPILAKLPYDAPQAPGSPKSVGTTEDSITLTWSAPKKDGGSPITGYVVEKREKGEEKWTKANITDIPDTEFQVKGLQEGKAYEFRVAAVNNAGIGEFSDGSGYIKALPPPVAPKINRDLLPTSKDIKAKVGEEFKIAIPYNGNPIPTVSWSQGGSPVLENNRIKFDIKPDMITLRCSKAELKDAGKYTLNLTNEKGSDSISMNVLVVDAPAKPEGPLEVKDITPESCILTWNPPKSTFSPYLEDGGSAVSNYVVEKQDKATGRWEPVSKFVRGTKYEVLGLTEGHEYNFRVSAENEYGVSEPLETSQSVVAQHPYTTPESPTSVAVDDVDESSVTLKWTKPKTDGGKKLEGYVIEYKEPSSNRWKAYNDVPIKENMGTVKGLDNDKEYEFRVRAKNAAGLGNPSDSTGPVQVKPKYVKPSTPGVPEASKVGRTFVELKWDKPRNDGGAKITGYVIEKREKGMNLWSKANEFPIVDNYFTVTGLPENSEFEFRIAATNAAGTGEPSLPCAPIKIKEKISGQAPDFVKKLSNTKASVGGEAAFSIEISGHPPPQLTWFRNGIEINTVGRNRVKVDGNTYTLLMSDVSEKDAGEITCEAKNALGKESCSAQLSVLAPPRFDKDLKDQKVTAGEQFKVKLPFSGTGPFDVKVKRDGRELQESDRIKISPFDDFLTFLIKDCEREDSGRYSIEISNDSGTAAVPFNLKVVSPPGAPSGPLAVSDITKSTCRLAWKPPKDDGGGKINSYLVERQEVGKPYWVTVSSHCKDTSIDVQGLYENSQYLFRVAAVTENGPGEFLQAESPIIAKMPFDAPETPGVPNVTEVGGDFVSLTWDKPKSDGGGKIQGYWVEKRERGTENWTRVNNNLCITNMINIPNLIEDRQYEFRVFAQNEAGLSKPSTASNSVKIKDPHAAEVPEFTSGLRKIQAVEGRTARFECEVSGNPKPDIQWFKGVREIYDSDKFEIVTEGNKQILIVKNIYGEDADEYSVRATNRGGSRVSRAELEIRSPPKINVPPRFREVCTFEKGENVVLKIPFTGNPKPTVKWIRDNEELRGSRFHQEVTERHAILTIKDASKLDDGPYRLQLDNELGSDSVVLKVQVNDRPDPPRFPVVENIRDDSVVLSWKPPLNDGGSFITEYVIERNEPPSDKWLRVASTRFNFHNVTGLSPNKEYRFRVFADNFYGRSEACEPTAPVKTEEPEAIRKKKQLEDEFGRRVRGKYDGPKINDYDKFYEDIWKKYVPQPVEIKQGSVYDYYDILEELGSGAFGVVHRCIEKATGRVFVAKFINTPYPLDKYTVKNEISIMNQLHHPKLINLHDAFEDKYEMVLILEFLSGGELFDRIAAEDYKMSEAEVINYMRQACEGLKHMHEHSIVHLDIKPENIMCETKKANSVKIIDFGLATKLNPDEIVKVTTATAEFASPEIVDREPVGFYTDMWAIGVLAYVLLSGLSPFAGEDDLETLQNVKRCDWEFDEEAFSSVSPEAKDFIRSLLQKDTKKRMTVHEALDHAWLQGDHSNLTNRIPSSRYNRIRQKIKEKYADWPAPQPAIGRIANFSSLRKHRPQEYQIYDTFFDRKEAAPRFVRKPRNQLTAEGQTAKFDCKIVAASPPIVTWYKDDSVLGQSYKHMQKYMGLEYELKISRIKMDDKGEYTVRAENSFGRKDEKATLKVEPGVEKPSAPSRETTPSTRKRIFEEKEFEKPVEDMSPNFNFDLRPRIIQAHSEFKLICCVQAHPPPKVQWYKDGREIQDGDHYTIKYSFGICTMEITNAKPEDSGKYTCIAINNLGQHETSCKVVVEDRVSSVTKETGSSQTSRTVRRTKSGVNIDEFSSYEESSSSSSVKKGRRGETIEESSYTSRKSTVKSSTSSSSRSDGREEPKEEAPKFTETLSPVTVNEGEGFTLSCSVTGVPEPNIEWFQNGQLLKSDDIISISFSRGVAKLKVGESVLEDDGDYVCKATNTAGVASTKANVTVIAKKVAPAKRVESVEAPRFIEPLQGQSASDGDPVTLQCRLSGKPDQVQWFRDGSEIKPSDDFRYENAGDLYKLIIVEIFPEDAGVYTCKATNAGGSISSSSTVFVAVPDEDSSAPVFTSFPKSVSLDEGNPVTFSCNLDSPSTVTVSWSKDGRPISDSGRFTFAQDGNSASFTIPAALSTDSGTYSVTASDDRGQASWTFSLLVRIGDSTSGDVDVQSLIDGAQ